MKNEKLSYSEREILSLVAVGKTDEEIAAKLNKSLHAVKTDIHSVFMKIGAPDRIQAALWAAKNL